MKYPWLFIMVALVRDSCGFYRAKYKDLIRKVFIFRSRIQRMAFKRNIRQLFVVCLFCSLLIFLIISNVSAENYRSKNLRDALENGNLDAEVTAIHLDSSLHNDELSGTVYIKNTGQLGFSDEQGLAVATKDYQDVIIPFYFNVKIIYFK
jgi:hypothetical protein